MPSEAQTLANRRKAEESAGMRTAERKTLASQNAKLGSFVQIDPDAPAGCRPGAGGYIGRRRAEGRCAKRSQLGPGGLIACQRRGCPL